MVFGDVDLGRYQVAANFQIAGDMRLEVAMGAIEKRQALEVLTENVGIEGRAFLPREVKGALFGIHLRFEFAVGERVIAGEDDAIDAIGPARLQLVDRERANGRRPEQEKCAKQRDDWCSVFRHKG